MVKEYFQSNESFLLDKWGDVKFFAKSCKKIMTKWFMMYIFFAFSPILFLSILDYVIIDSQIDTRNEFDLLIIIAIIVFCSKMVEAKGALIQFVLFCSLFAAIVFYTLIILIKIEKLDGVYYNNLHYLILLVFILAAFTSFVIFFKEIKIREKDKQKLQKYEEIYGDTAEQIRLENEPNFDSNVNQSSDGTKV